MFNTGNILRLLLFVTSLIALVQALSTVDDESVQNTKKQRKLSRKRRYLIFPTGSSIQLVYDSTITIPDYTLYVTTGVTVALAYGLPDKPIYPESELMERYENGSLPLLQYRKDKNVTDSNRDGEITATTSSNIKLKDTATSSYLNYDYNGNNAVNRIANYYKYFQHRKPDSFYFGNSPLNVANYNKAVNCMNRNCAYGNMSYYSNDKVNRKSGAYNSYNIRPPYSATFDVEHAMYDAFKKYMNETYFKPSFSQTKSTAIPTKPTTTKKATTTKPPEFKPIINKLHTVYPAMGKRSVHDTSLNYEQKFYLDHHRNTRHKLYNIIEKYLFAKGYNGTECVLKTLCEVGQKQHETEPGSFLAEIVRVVFSLPVAQLQRAIHKRHIEYDNAHQIAANCDAKFPLCPASIWNAGFLIDSDAFVVNNNNGQNVLIKNK